MLYMRLPVICIISVNCRIKENAKKILLLTCMISGTISVSGTLG